MNKKELEQKLIVGAVIEFGEEYCKSIDYYRKPGEKITLIEGSFYHENGLYGEEQTCPSIWNEDQKEFDSIYHLFGNDLEDFTDCKIVEALEVKP